MFRSEAEVLAGKRRSMFTAGEKLEAEERSPEDTAGADTEAEVVRRQAKLGALGGDVLAEMRYCWLDRDEAPEHFFRHTAINFPHCQ